MPTEPQSHYYDVMPLFCPGPRWGRLRLRERIGTGAFGDVYRAFDPRLGSDVALKLLRPGSSIEPIQSRVERESRNLSRVRHPNVVAYHGVRSGAASAGLWMELVSGATLAQLLSIRGTFYPEVAAAVGRDVCRALSAVHEAGVIHGDVKAQNVMRDDEGRIVLMDFGSSRSLGEVTSGVERLTGTPAYLSPEVLNGSNPSIASDIYSLGVLLFHLVTGEYPVVGESVASLKAAHAAARCRRITELHDGLPKAFVDAVEAALRPAAARTPTAAALLDLLDRVERPRSLALDSYSTLGRQLSFIAADRTTRLMARTTRAVSIPFPPVIAACERRTSDSRG